MRHPDNRPAEIHTSAFKLDDYDLEAVRREMAGLPEVDEERMCLERLHRVQAELQARDLGGMLLYDPVNVRYATGSRNMQVWAMRNSSRYCLVPAEGQAVMFDFISCELVGVFPFEDELLN